MELLVTVLLVYYFLGQIFAYLLLNWMSENKLWKQGEPKFIGCVMNTLLLVLFFWGWIYWIVEKWHDGILQKCLNNTE